MSEPVCRVCNRPLAEHEIRLFDGVAHTYIVSGDRRSPCSEADAERHYYAGQIAVLQMVIRSLRNRAGRLRGKNDSWWPEHLFSYADKWQKDRERLIGVVQRYFDWSEKEP
jgi:hypothetical protein